MERAARSWKVAKLKNFVFFFSKSKKNFNSPFRYPRGHISPRKRIKKKKKKVKEQFRRIYAKYFGFQVSRKRREVFYIHTCFHSYVRLSRTPPLKRLMFKAIKIIDLEGPKSNVRAYSRKSRNKTRLSSTFSLSLSLSTNLHKLHRHIFSPTV